MVWLYLFFALLAIGLIYLFTLPKGYTVSRKLVFDAPVEIVFAQVHDFRNWRAWSPWLLHDADAKETVLDPLNVGGSNAWDSTKIGSGKTTHLEIIPNQSIHQQLNFYKPFKAVAADNFLFSHADGQTTVTWTMQAPLPIFMRPFRGMFERMIGRDFELGLALMRGIVDPQAEKPSLQFDGVVQKMAVQGLTQSFKGDVEAMKLVMQAGYPSLYAAAQNRVTGPAFAAYHKVNANSDAVRVDCDFGVPVNSFNPQETAFHVPGGAYFQMTLRGSYQFLGSAWNAHFGQLKMCKLKHDKRRPMLEVYLNNPDQVAHSNDLETLLLIPVKGA